MVTAPLVAPRSAVGLWCEQTPTRVATAVYLAITAGIYHTLLASQWDPQGWRLVSDTLLHTVTPALFLLDWLARGGVGPVVWRGVPKVLILPTAYGVWTLLHGALSPAALLADPARGLLTGAVGWAPRLGSAGEDASGLGALDYR